MGVKSQNSWVCSQLLDKVTLSSLDSVVRYGIQDLPKRVSELRAMGMRINKVTMTGTNRHGRKCRWAEYCMLPEDIEHNKEVAHEHHLR